MQRIRVSIIYPTDPLGVSPGGIDPFIRGILRWAPDDIQFSVLGVSTDSVERPVGVWHSFDAMGARFDFYPLVGVSDSGRQSAIPLTVRFMAGLLRERGSVEADVLEFHRIEPSLLFLNSGKAIALVMHQNMQDIRNKGSDIRWRHFPWLYFRLEAYALRRASSLFCVREDAVEDYRSRFPELAEQIRFTPTWPDIEVFAPVAEAERMQLRQSACTKLNIPDGHRLLVSVGRLDRQKNPQLMLDALARLCRQQPEVSLLMVGDGVLRDKIENRIAELGLSSNVRMCGLLPAQQIADLLRISDAFVLSSDYEGMPICVLEALATGLPVATTDVGEVRRVVKPGVNGEICETRNADALAAAIGTCLTNAAAFRGPPCTAAIEPYSPPAVLEPIYENYRRIAAG
jgi:glycosyltransferase involved in cell wall biosynthesis